MSAIQKSPWRLYALSNFGSFLALLSYPFLVEPYVRLRTQAVDLVGALCLIRRCLCGCICMDVLETRHMDDWTHVEDRQTHRPDDPLLARPRRRRFDPPTRNHQYRHAGHRRQPVLMDRAAVALPIDLCSCLRTRPLVSAHVFRDCRRGARPRGLCGSQRGHRRGDLDSVRRLLGGSLRGLHGLQRRIAILPAGTPLSHALLPHHRRGRSSGWSVRRADRAPNLYRIQRVPHWTRGSLPTWTHRLAAIRRVVAVDPEQFRDSYPDHGAAARRLELDADSHHERRAQGGRHLAQLLRHSARNGPSRSTWGVAGTHPWAHQARLTISGTSFARPPDFVLRPAQWRLNGPERASRGSAQRSP